MFLDGGLFYDLPVSRECWMTGLMTDDLEGNWKETALK
jgi:hypothetical protein